MRGDYVKTTWVNGVAPGINATRLNNSENKINEIDKSVISKTARFTVGTSTSGWTAGDCDYLCDGVNDQIKINNAITALPVTGGEIIILDGTYNITAKISVNKVNVTLSGNGNGTILKRMYNSTLNEGIIQAETGANECKVRDFYINGNKATYTNANNHGILLLSSGNTISGNICKNSSGTGIYSNIQGYNTITGNVCNGNTANGIFLNGNGNIISANNCDINGTGISLNTSSNNAIIGNRCNGNIDTGIMIITGSYNAITSNTCNSNVNGIFTSDSNYNVIAGNVVNNNTSLGIYMEFSNKNNISGNTCIRGTGIVGDYTASQYTIYLFGTANNYNLVSSNMCMGKDVVSGGGTSNTLVNNKFT